MHLSLYDPKTVRKKETKWPGFRLLWSGWIGTECVEIGKFSAGLFGLWGLAASGLHHRTEVTYIGGNGYYCLQVSGKKTINFCTKNCKL